MGRVRKLNDSERKSIVSMFPQLGVTETARRVGCSKSTVQRVWAADGAGAADAQGACPGASPPDEPETTAEPETSAPDTADTTSETETAPDDTQIG